MQIPFFCFISLNLDQAICFNAFCLYFWYGIWVFILLCILTLLFGLFYNWLNRLFNLILYLFYLNMTAKIIFSDVISGQSPILRSWWRSWTWWRGASYWMRLLLWLDCIRIDWNCGRITNCLVHITQTCLPLQHLVFLHSFDKWWLPRERFRPSCLCFVQNTLWWTPSNLSSVLIIRSLLVNNTAFKCGILLIPYRYIRLLQLQIKLKGSNLMIKLVEFECLRINGYPLFFISVHNYNLLYL